MKQKEISPGEIAGIAFGVGTFLGLCLAAAVGGFTGSGGNFLGTFALSLIVAFVLACFVGMRAEKDEKKQEMGDG